MKKYLFLILFPIAAFSLRHEPWFGGVYEFELTSLYEYSFFSKFNEAVPPLSGTSHDHLLYFDLSLPFSSSDAVDVDLNFQKTPRRDFGFQSVAGQFRHLFLDDVAGDFISLEGAFSLRYTSSKSLKDISCFSHGDADIIGDLGFGKEFNQGAYWHFRLWGLLGVGIANRGSPWLRELFTLEFNRKDEHVFSLFLFAEEGFGRKTWVNIHDFYGYGKVRSKHLDLTLRYGFRLREWGTLRFEYTRTLIAKRYPEAKNSFAISYLFPFSF